MTEKDFNKIPTNDQCPFMKGIVIKEYKKLVELASINSNSTYELIEKDGKDSNFFNNIKIEKLVLADKKTYEGKFIKFFKTKFLLSLNTYSLGIFVYISENLEMNNNKIILDITKIGLYLGIKEPRRVYDGLADLIEKKVIAKHNTKDVYYINPNIIFRGPNRKILYTHQNY